jgi:hypothetical protein
MVAIPGSVIAKINLFFNDLQRVPWVRLPVALILFCNIGEQNGAATTVVAAFNPESPLGYPRDFILN